MSELASLIIVAIFWLLVSLFGKRTKNTQNNKAAGRDGKPAGPYLGQVGEMAAKAKAAGLNIDYFPTNFVVREGLLWYIDYECNEYMDQWSFENWGIRYWSRTQEFEACLKEQK